jgi:integrase
MPKLKLTDAAVQRLKAPPGARVDYFDATLPGFGLRVSGPTPRSPEGRRTWMLFYRFRGEQKRLSFEPPYPALSLADARKKAGDALATLPGSDPAEEKAKAKAPRKAPDTLQTVVEEFITRGMAKKGRAAGYMTETRRSFTNHVLPRFGGRELAAITRRDIIEMLDEIAEKGTTRTTPGGKRHADGGPVAANRVLSAVRALFNWAIRRGLVDANPCALVEPPGEETSRERTLSPDELRDLWPAFAALGYPFGPYLQLLLVLGQRRSEVAGMRWADIDLEAKTWTLGGEDTKNGRGHVVPLSDLAVRILTALPRKAAVQADGQTKHSAYVFTTSGSAPISGFSKAKQRVEEAVVEARQERQEQADMPSWGLHDLRRTAATEMGRLGTSEFIIGLVLNHTRKGITGSVYNRYQYLAEKRHALEAWASFVESLTQPADKKVVVLRA